MNNVQATGVLVVKASTIISVTSVPLSFQMTMAHFLISKEKAVPKRKYSCRSFQIGNFIFRGFPRAFDMNLCSCKDSGQQPIYALHLPKFELLRFYKYILITIRLFVQ